MFVFMYVFMCVHWCILVYMLVHVCIFLYIRISSASGLLPLASAAHDTLYVHVRSTCSDLCSFLGSSFLILFWDSYLGLFFDSTV